MALLVVLVAFVLRATGVPDVGRIIPSTTTTDEVHLAPQEGAPLPAVRAPHHDDTLHVVMPVGEWEARRGDQSVIDQGLVVFWGEPCSHLWLAAHRSTHGAPFARLPETKPGDRWEVTSPSVACIYRIDRVQPVTSNVVPPFGDLMAQTSLPGGWFLVFGTRV